MRTSGPHRQTPDSELIRQYRELGKMDVLGVLFKRYTSMVYGVCLRYLKDREESKDAVMQIFEKLASSLHSHEVTYFKSWLYATARNHCLMEIRGKKGKKFEELGPLIMESGAAGHPDDGQELEENLVKLEKCIEALKNEQKHCVQLFYLEQKCYKEITEVTGYDFNQVKSHIQNGKRNLKNCLEQPHG
jgi:RNA polymerase sigma-70 factor (ECF subfamily)